jgi:ribonuclease VapC
MDVLHEAEGPLLLSAVNYAEVVIQLEDRHPGAGRALEDLMEETEIQIKAPGQEEALIAARARLKYPLNLGDCFAYALAKVEECPLLTLDRDFRRTDVELMQV